MDACFSRVKVMIIINAAGTPVSLCSGIKVTPGSGLVKSGGIFYGIKSLSPII